MLDIGRFNVKNQKAWHLQAVYSILQEFGKSIGIW